MDHFVVGFAFNIKKDRVLLIEKKRPEWQKGLLNGIGGKIEDEETPDEAMKREAFEEAALNIDWIYKGKMIGANNDGHPFECHIFYAYSDDIFSYQQREDEFLSLYDPLSCIGTNVITNLNFLIPYGLFDDGSKSITLTYD